jgi:hypothetical protein
MNGWKKWTDRGHWYGWMGQGQQEDARLINHEIINEKNNG